MALTPFDMEGVNRDLLAAGNPAKPDMQSILRRNARDLVLGNAILVSSVDAKELEFGVHMAYSDADGGFDTDPSEDVWFEASSLPIPNERPDLPPDNALRIRVTDVLTEYGFTDIDVKAPDRTPEGIWIGFEAMQPVRLDVTSAQGGRSVSFTLTAAEANDWRSGRLDAAGRRYDGGKESVDRFWNDMETDRGLAVEPRYVELAFGCPPIEWDIDARVRDFAERMGDEYTSLYEQDTTGIKGGDFERFGAFADNHLDFMRALTKARGMDPISSDREIGAFLNTFDKLAAMPEPTPAKQEKDELSAGACDPADPLNLEQSSSYGMTR